MVGCDTAVTMRKIGGGVVDEESIIPGRIELFFRKEPSTRKLEIVSDS
jgi:hypothetical protein